MAKCGDSPGLLVAVMDGKNSSFPKSVICPECGAELDVSLTINTDEEAVNYD